jgi:glycosyltransferase involved in cell wall biosynthesis
MHYKIAYLTSKDPLDKNEASGVYYYQSRALKKQNMEIHHLGPVNNFIIRFLKTGFKLVHRFLNKKYNTDHSIIISKIYGRVFSKKLKKGNYDIVFADKASCELAYINTDIPVIYSTDATFKLLNNYYPHLSGLFKVSEKEGNIIEQNAINRSCMVICASRWAATSVVNDYDYPSEKVYVIPRGANIDIVPDKELIANKKKNDVCHLLFIGWEYYRKGYDIAYQTMAYIRSKGIPVKLIAAGCCPPSEFIDKDVEIMPYLNKNTQKGMAEFNKVMLNSDFYILPTRAECMGIGFCESAAYGLPVITRDTGGVTEVVKNGINGYTLDHKADHRDFGEKIISIFKSDEKYYNLVHASRNYFEERLNWDVWSANLKNIFDGYFACRIKEQTLYPRLNGKTVHSNIDQHTSVFHP